MHDKLYELGFSHNNCGGVCVRAGRKHWLHLLDVFPDRYAQADDFVKKPFVKGMYANPVTMHAWKYVYIEHDPAKWD